MIFLSEQSIDWVDWNHCSPIESLSHNTDTTKSNSMTTPVPSTKPSSDFPALFGKSPTFPSARDDIILGSVDSLITVMSVISTFHGIGGIPPIIIIIALAVSNTITDGVSMFSSRYLSQTTHMDRETALNSGFYTWISFTICGLLPVIPFLLPIHRQAMFFLSYVVALIVLFTAAKIGYQITAENINTADMRTHLVEVVLLPVGTIVLAYIIGYLFGHR